MFDKLKKWFDGLVEKLGLKIPDDKKTEIETALKEFAEGFEKEGSEGDKDAATALAEAMRKALEGALPKPTEKEKPETNPGSPDLGKALAEAMKPFADELAAIKKGLGDIEKVRKETENAGRKAKIEATLKEAHQKGKISSKQVSDYKKALEDALEKSPESFDFSIKVISGLPDNNIIAKQNKVAGFSLDGKPNEEPEGKDGKDGKDGEKPKAVPVMGSLDPRFLEKVNNDIR